MPKQYDNLTMHANLFLWINGLIVLVLVIRLLMGRNYDRPTDLKFDSPSSKKPVTNDHFENTSPGHDTSPGFDTSPGYEKTPNEKVLNCLFQFNGHTWDAFEVLGIPAGSDWDSCQRALLDYRRQSGKAEDFLNALEISLKGRFGRR